MGKGRRTRLVIAIGVGCLLVAGVVVSQAAGKSSNPRANVPDQHPTTVHTPQPTPTLSATLLPPTATPAPEPPATPAPTATRSTPAAPTHTTDTPETVQPLLVGEGFSDVSPHQVVRTSAGVLYVVVPDCASYPECPANRLRVYKADTAGTPTSFVEQDLGNAPAGGIGGNAIAIDGNDIIHALWVDRSGAARSATFDTTTDRWNAGETLAPTGWDTFGQGDEGAALALDASGTPHAFWNGRGSDGKLHIWYAQRSAAGWTTPLQVDDVPLAENHSAWHPTIAFAPDGALLLAWLDGTFNYTPDGVIRVRVRAAAGAWGATTTIADTAMTAIDNGPSLLVTPDGVRHLTFLDTQNRIRYWYDDGAGWRGDRQPAQQTTHNPALGPDGAGGIFIYGHGAPTGDIAGHGDDLYRLHLPLDGVWSAWTLYARGSFDSSVSTRWSQFFHADPQRLDIVFWADPYPNLLYLGTEEVDGER